MKQPGSFTVHTGHAGPLFYAEAGSGFPLLLLHGNGEDHTYFENQLEFFSKSRRVIAVDCNGKAIPPCGACRAFMTQLMPDDYCAIEIMLDYERGRIVTLGDLTPEWRL